MLKFAILIAVICLGCRLVFGRWPWQLASVASTREQAIFKARKLLNVSAKANHSEIRAAHRRMTAMVHPDKGGTNAEMQELNAARDLLLDELPNEIEPPEQSE